MEREVASELKIKSKRYVYTKLIEKNIKIIILQKRDIRDIYLLCEICLSRSRNNFKLSIKKRGRPRKNG